MGCLPHLSLCACDYDLTANTLSRYLEGALGATSFGGLNELGIRIRRFTTRLQSHASGRRSGDEFCLYVADRLVLPSLSQEDITAIASGRHQMDAFVRLY